VLCLVCSSSGDVYSQKFDDMFGLLQSLEARLIDLHGICFILLLSVLTAFSIHLIII